MLEFKEKFDTSMGVKSSPNSHEEYLLERAQKYSKILSHIPGVEMIAVVNSVSMNATHNDSDIDFFIIAKPQTIWFVRFTCTLILWVCGVWRHGSDIPGNICLSFFITSDCMNLENIAIQDDIYLFYWIYYMKPLYDTGGVFKAFVEENAWFKEWKKPLSPPISEVKEFSEKYSHKKPIVYGNNFGYRFLISLNTVIRYFLMPRSLKSYEKKGRPDGVIISDTMLKFHDKDKRREIRDMIFGK